MADMVLQSNTLPEPLFRLIKTDKVKVRESHGEIRLIPIQEKITAIDCPLLGMFANGKLTVEKHFAWSREDKITEAGRLKATYKISLADSFALAQTKISNGVLLTSDHPEFDVIENKEPIKFLWIR